MKMDDIISEVITILITKADIDKSKGEEVPPGGVLNALQLIIEEGPVKETAKITMKVTKERKRKLGKDLQGENPGVNVVNPKFVSRLSRFFAHYKILSIEENIICCLSPYTSREDIVNALPKVDDCIKKYEGTD